ncbi:MAG: hypothetical protein F4213_17115 [Boseongicola sp. SB0677_bin_26]|nr:hypothetical protein [Boseongicola sp. SB0677_bin_26]
MADPKRPWQGAEKRLGLKLFGRGGAGSQQPDAGIGWMLLRLRPPVIEEGEVPVPAPDLPDHVDLSAAEYRTLREDCGLSLAETAVFHAVRQGTVKRWETAGPPGGAAAELAGLRAQIEVAANVAARNYLDALAERPDIDGVELYRYQTWSYPETRQGVEGLPHGAHNRLIARTADLLATCYVPVRILYAEPDSAPAFRTAQVEESGDDST